MLNYFKGCKNNEMVNIGTNNKNGLDICYNYKYISHRNSHKIIINRIYRAYTLIISCLASKSVQ